MEKLKNFIFNNILPATFQESLTYLEQIRVLKSKLNETIEQVNKLTEIINNMNGGDDV